MRYRELTRLDQRRGFLFYSCLMLLGCDRPTVPWFKRCLGSVSSAGLRPRLSTQLDLTDLIFATMARHHYLKLFKLRAAVRAIFSILGCMAMISDFRVKLRLRCHCTSRISMLMPFLAPFLSGPLLRFSVRRALIALALVLVSHLFLVPTSIYTSHVPHNSCSTNYARIEHATFLDDRPGYMSGSPPP